VDASVLDTLTMPTHRQRHAQRAARAETASAADAAHDTSVRLDKWLWAARFYKTRELAQAAIEAGRVKSDGERLKPAHAVRSGQQYTITREGLNWTVEVTGVSETRGSAAVAQALYREDEASIAERKQVIELNRAAGAPTFKGRPTKRQRRKIEDFLAEP
jgi:ribosome-associated heat shock protein Hsp15